MTNKYVIRNCPCFFPAEGQDLQGFCCGWTRTEELFCQDCTDCIMKKIVELCKEDWEDMTVDKFQSKLLNKLDIEECESENSQN